ncbi:MAG: (2Fe-2S)-binding protein [Candidatus Eisenbacteria bacterium]|uniref:(2Fe-2S)-binding protein n=1 Tax=Eiseniibacteriota bacterium TaxID=2212470 RepID=A0A948WEM0_UNCEI|nr:(2Fe-2S)-binding protein [Candidatus Eisenbacteria bacterium]MBU1950296.1 (2Fe-2S)-binding protein [Candidatus Eisenbacteria bacterium]MBU2692888.1 (2Fe-2S)-binding protein [Candidatus Eisenbacteria bacterium]
MGSVTIEIDGRQVTVEEGLNVIQAAQFLDIQIPHFCYHEGLGVDGNCRMCLVEVEGMPKLQPACNLFVKEGLKVRTRTPQVMEHRRLVLECLFLNHPIDCSICDQSGECYLQDYYLDHGNYRSRYDLPKRLKRKRVDAGPHVILDAERCVLCARCVRFCDNITKTGELRIVNRGDRSEITLFPGKKLDNPYSLNTVQICPVGALTSKDFRFSWRVWFLKSAHSICTGCSRGCNIIIDHADNHAYRYQARCNPQVNGYWLCDDGRLSYKMINDHRLHVLTEPSGNSRDTFPRFEEALSGIGRQIEGASSVTALMSPDLSNEDLYAASRFAKEIAGSQRMAAGSLKPDGVEDELLRKADAHPNTSGCKTLNLWGDLKPAIDAGGDLLLVFGSDLLQYDNALLKKIRSSFKSIIIFASHEMKGFETGAWLIPIACHAEMDGSFTNFEGRVQKFDAAIRRRGDTLPLWRILGKIGRAMQREWGWSDLAGLRRDLTDEFPQWKEALIEATPSNKTGVPLKMTGTKEAGEE